MVIVPFQALNFNKPNLPLVLKGLAIYILAQSKVWKVHVDGISSQISEIIKRINRDCDGVDIGLNLLRSRIAVIPQDPVLF